MPRLFGFDYKTPFFYMVTLKRLPGLCDFSSVSEDGRLLSSPITEAFAGVLARFHETWSCIEPISPFAIMPDHIHMIVKIKNMEPRKSLPVLVWQLERALSAEYWEIVGGRSGTLAASPRIGVLRGAAAPAPVFEKSWHDWIVKKEGQLAAFRRYVRENPMRAALRRRNARFFGNVSTLSFLGRDWFASGNPALLGLPVLAPFKGHRATAPGSPEWNALLAAASRIGPGGAAVSTFMSPLEKECGNAVYRAGGSFVALCPDGFGPRWHPPREKERLCAEGRMLFLSLNEATGRKPDAKTLYRRCHEMIDWVAARLTT